MGKLPIKCNLETPGTTLDIDLEELTGKYDSYLTKLDELIFRYFKK
jgi:hypothetical protein